MMPLQSIAMGLVIVVLVARFDSGHDALADPVGWLLVVWGVRRLHDRTLVLALAVVALLFSCVLWLPWTLEALERNDPSLRWAVNLPQVIFCIALCHHLAGLASASGDRSASAWLRTTMVLNVVLAVAPVLVFAAGADEAMTQVYAGAGGVLLLLIVLLFGYARRPWVDVS
ncbi:hypothetical protein [Nocardioides piscis]|uniref:Uncharacterized protein n=1 Tax=Nocardioides piscis TaxID=2714938 RepID=A0A6G7YDZ7_9ACTN|nr:hypothetical protein [Nocardioides piscis]QIK74949.1 hypothetical protein G7071_05400 [Nocardioides piscis]